MSLEDVVIDVKPVVEACSPGAFPPPDSVWNAIEKRDLSPESPFEEAKEDLEKYQNRQYSCPYCEPPVNLTRAWNLKRHILKRHRDQLFYCKVCPNQSVDMAELRQHYLEAHDTAPVGPSMVGRYDPLGSPAEDSPLPVEAPEEYGSVAKKRKHSESYTETPAVQRRSANIEIAESSDEEEDLSGKNRLQLDKLLYKKTYYKGQYEQMKARCLKLQLENERLRRENNQDFLGALQSRLGEQSRQLNQLTLENEEQNAKIADFQRWLNSASAFLEVLNSPSTSQENGAKKSVFAERTEDSSAAQYFQFYGYLSQQQNMMQDYVRTSTYQKAVLMNPADFRGKVR